MGEGVTVITLTPRARRPSQYVGPSSFFSRETQRTNTKRGRFLLRADSHVVYGMGVGFRLFYLVH